MNLNLICSFLKKMTLKKTINYLKIKTSYLYSIISKNPVRLGIPWSISIEPTNYCNLKCPQCPVGLNWLKRPRGFIDYKLYKEIIDTLSPYLINLFLYFQGEPFLHQRIIDMIHYAHNKKIFTALSTNGHFLTENIAKKIVMSGLDKIIIPVDGIDQDTYSKYRKNGNLYKVLEGVKNLVVARHNTKTKLPFIELQFLALKTNEKQIKDFKLLAKELNVDDYTIKTAQIIDFQTANLFIPTNLKLSRYYQKNNKWYLKKKLKNRCARLWNSAVITWNGIIVPCCYDKDAKYSLGNWSRAEVNQIFNNINFKKFAKQILTNRSSIDICSNCNE